MNRMKIKPIVNCEGPNRKDGNLSIAVKLKF